jgi:hypothetical protein
MIRDVCAECDRLRAPIYSYPDTGLRVCAHHIPNEVCS